MEDTRRMEISKDKTKVTYSVDFIQKLIGYLYSLNTKEAREYAFKLSVDESRVPQRSELEIEIRSLTSAERKAIIYGSSLPKDSEILQILRRLVNETKSEN